MVIAENRFAQAGTTAMVFEPGECVIAHHHIGKILWALKKQYGRRKQPDNILVEVTERRVKFGLFDLALEHGERIAIKKSP